MDSTVSNHSISYTTIDKDQNSYYAGIQSARSMKKITPSTGIRLYHRLLDEQNTIPLNIQLHLAYKDTNKQLYHFPIVEVRGNWMINCVALKRRKFESLEKLIEYYDDFELPHPTIEGLWESFPVWDPTLKELCCY